MRFGEPHISIRLAGLVFLIGSVFPAFAALDIDSLKPQGYLSDYANVVDDASKQQIEQYCTRVEQGLGVQLALVTLPTLDGRDIETVANQLFRHFGVGSKQGDQGVLLLLAINDRKNRIEVGYGIEPYLTDGFSGSILRSMTPELRGGNYGAALLNGAQAMGAQIARGKGLAIPGAQPVPRPQPSGSRGGGGLPFPLLLLGGLFLLFWIFGRGGRGRGGGGGGFLTGMLLGNMLGGGRSRDWGGGGFGGWDSGGGGGGGFGGFGGGSSGGGGASGSW